MVGDTKMKINAIMELPEFGRLLKFLDSEENKHGYPPAKDDEGKYSRISNLRDDYSVPDTYPMMNVTVDVPNLPGRMFPKEGLHKLVEIMYYYVEQT
jgi:hypothetical protein